MSKSNELFMKMREEESSFATEILTDLFESFKDHYPKPKSNETMLKLYSLS